jgi:hypothetical protein
MSGMDAVALLGNLGLRSESDWSWKVKKPIGANGQI